jgi:PiT family inorganic phosphate transporter
MAAYPLFKFIAAGLGVTRETCVCVGREWVPIAAFTQGAATASSAAGLRVIVDERFQCAQRYSGTVFGVNAQSALDACHYLSAGAVSFARGLNDTPKIVALGLSFGSLGLTGSVALVALAMAVGGLIDARKIAETVSRRITTMDHGEGFTANLVTSLLVIGASRWGLPVSTTHVSCGALFGIGIANGQARWRVIRSVLLAWILTLPLAGLSAGLIYAIGSWLS